jgi:hypothetical protein
MYNKISFCSFVAKEWGQGKTQFVWRKSIFLCSAVI